MSSAEQDQNTRVRQIQFAFRELKNKINYADEDPSQEFLKTTWKLTIISFK